MTRLAFEQWELALSRHFLSAAGEDASPIRSFEVTAATLSACRLGERAFSFWRADVRPLDPIHQEPHQSGLPLRSNARWRAAGHFAMHRPRHGGTVVGHGKAHWKPLGRFGAKRFMVPDARSGACRGCGKSRYP